jgi:hypothetical protein
MRWPSRVSSIQCVSADDLHIKGYARIARRAVQLAMRKSISHEFGVMPIDEPERLGGHEAGGKSRG